MLTSEAVGKLLQLSRAVTRVEGKKGVPSFPARAGKSRIDVQGDMIEIEQHAGDPLATFDAAAGVLDAQGKSAPFVPIAVYKSLTKMAIAVMPPAHLPQFGHTIDWIKNPNRGSLASVGRRKTVGPLPPAPVAGENLGR